MVSRVKVQGVSILFAGADRDHVSLIMGIQYCIYLAKNFAVVEALQNGLFDVSTIVSLLSISMMIPSQLRTLSLKRFNIVSSLPTQLFIRMNSFSGED